MENPAIGLHVIGTVEVATDVLRRSFTIYRDLILGIVQRNGLTVCGDAFHEFEGGGFTGTVVLAESHVSLHTWFELGFIHLDVFTCNFTRSNDEVCRKTFQDIAALFSPTAIHWQEIRR